MNDRLGAIRVDTGPSEIGLPESDFLREAGEALVGGDAYFRQVLDLLPAAIYITDASGFVTYYNEAAARLMGHRPQLA